MSEQEILTPAEAGAALDNMIKEYRGAPPSATPTDAAGAAARLAALTADPEWGKRLTSGDLAARREWQQLTTLIASGDHPARGDLAAKNQFNALNRTIAYAADADTR